MKTDILSLIKSGIYSDFEIKVGDKIIKTHKYILAAKSEYFKLLFEQKDVVETEKNMLTIRNYSFEIVDNLIMFCYTKRLKLTSENIHETLCCAHAYDLNEALYHCGYYMDRNQHIKHLESLATLMPCLALDWIYLRLVKTYSKQKFTTLDLSIASYELLRDMATRKQVSCNMMSYVIAKWYRLDPVNRHDQADSLFHHLSFDQADNANFTSITESELMGQFEGLRRSIDRAAFCRAIANKYPYGSDVRDASLDSICSAELKVPEYPIDLPEFVMDLKYVDFTILIDENTIEAHKIVLIANSDYFANLLRDASKKCDSLTIQNYKFEIVESLINLCYTKELALDESNIEETLLCAHKFGFKEGLYRCAHYITFKPQVSLFILVSRLMPCPILGRCYYDSIRYYSRHFYLIKEHDKILEELSYDVLKDLAQNGIQNNSQKFSDLVVEWYEADPESRLNNFESLLHQIDFKSIEGDRLYLTNLPARFEGLRRLLWERSKNLRC